MQWIVFSSRQNNQAKSQMVVNVRVSGPELNHILTQPVKHNTLCSAAGKKAWKTTVW